MASEDLSSFRWYGFNSGSTFMVSTPETADIAARASVVTTLGGCAGGVAAILYLKLVHGTWDLCGTCNGLLCGLVSVTGGAATFEPWAALITGPIAAIVFLNLEPLIQHTGVDDAVGASAMHGGCGTLGVLFVGLFTKGKYALQLLGKTANDFDGAAYKGIFYGGNGKLLGCQIIGALPYDVAWPIV
jgi:Amt family ammonium transporter